MLEIKSQFENDHQKQFGFIAPEKKLMIEAVSVEVIVDQNKSVNEPGLPFSTQKIPVFFRKG